MDIDLSEQMRRAELIKARIDRLEEKPGALEDFYPFMIAELSLRVGDADFDESLALVMDVIERVHFL
jgi:hypothetical protein